MRREKLRGLFDGEEVGDGLLDAVVEDLEVVSAEAFDEATGAVGDGDADVHAIYGDADGRGGLLGLRPGRRRGQEKEKEDSQKWLSHRYSSHSSKWMPLESFQEAPARKWRWRTKAWGSMLSSHSASPGGGCGAAAEPFLAGAAAEAFLACSIQRVFRAW